MTQTNKKAVVLLSGGLDSATTIHIAQSEGYEVYALTVIYGQKNHHEIDSAKKVAKRAGAKEHKIIELNLSTFGGSSLTTDQEVEKNRPLEEIGKSIPSTYVPARNTILLSMALAWAEVLDANNIFIGVNAVDWSGYPDCRPEYIEAFEKMANLATKMTTQDKEKLKIITPLINLKKKDIIKKGLSIDVDYNLTSTCYNPKANGKPCEECDSCTIRTAAFKELGLIDPLLQ